MNTIKAILLCATTLLLILSGTAVAQETKEDVAVITSPQKVQTRAIDNPPTGSSSVVGADVTIGSGVTVTIGTGVTMSLGGTLTNNGTLTAQTGSTVEFNGTDPQTPPQQTLSGANLAFSNLTKSGNGTLLLSNLINVSGTLTLAGGAIDNCPPHTINGTYNQVVSGSGGRLLCTSTAANFTFNNTQPFTPSPNELPATVASLTINGAGITLDAPRTVTNAINFVGGKITLNNVVLTLAQGGTVNGDPNNYIVTIGNDAAFKRVGVGPTLSPVAVLFPVGTPTSYNPVTITNAGTPDDFSVSVKSTFDSPPSQPNNVVNRQWTITEATPGGSNATLQFQWNASDQAAGFNTASPIVIGRHNGTQWGEQSATAGGANPYTATASGFTSFSPFAVGNTGALGRLVILANIKALLEGPFNSGTGLMNNNLRATVLPAQFPGRSIPADAVDSIQIEIRGTPSGVLSPIAGGIAEKSRVGVSSPLRDKPSRDTDAGLSQKEMQPDKRSRDMDDPAKAENSETVVVNENAHAQFVEGLTSDASVLPPNPKVSQPAWLLTDGTISNFTDITKNYVEFDTTAGNWYIVIRHRNHLAIMSAAARPLSSTTPTIYDFTTAQSQAFGTNPMKQRGSQYCMYAGDGDGGGGVGAADKNLVWRPQNGLLGYFGGDFDLGGGVGAADVNLYWRPNNGVVSQVP
jgi:hypothetical protein